MQEKILNELKGKFVEIKVIGNFGQFKYYHGIFLDYDEEFIYLYDKILLKMIIAREDLRLIHECDHESLDIKLNDFDRKADKVLHI